MEGLLYTLEARVHLGWQSALYFCFFLLGAAWAGLLPAMASGDWVFAGSYFLVAMILLALWAGLQRHSKRRARRQAEEELRDLLAQPPEFPAMLIGLLTGAPTSSIGSSDVDRETQRVERLLDGERDAGLIYLYLQARAGLIDATLGSTNRDQLATQDQLLTHAIMAVKAWDAVHRRSLVDQDRLPVPGEYADWRERYLGVLGRNPSFAM